MKLLAFTLSLASLILIGCSTTLTPTTPRTPSSENAEQALLQEASTNILKNSKSAKAFAFTITQSKANTTGKTVKDFSTWISADKKKYTFNLYDVVYNDQETVTCVMGGSLTYGQAWEKAKKNGEVPLKVICYVWFDENAQYKEVTGITQLQLYGYDVDSPSYISLQLEPKTKFPQIMQLENSILDDDE